MSDTEYSTSVLVENIISCLKHFDGVRERVLDWLLHGKGMKFIKNELNDMIESGEVIV
jgi:hypothetical protein